MSELIIGVDPGLTGGISFYEPGLLYAYRTPVEEHSFVKAAKRRLVKK